MGYKVIIFLLLKYPLANRSPKGPGAWLKLDRPDAGMAKFIYKPSLQGKKDLVNFTLLGSED